MRTTGLLLSILSCSVSKLIRVSLHCGIGPTRRRMCAVGAPFFSHLAPDRWHLQSLQKTCVIQSCFRGVAQRLRVEPTLPDKAFSMGVRPAACSTGDVCMALDYLEDPAVHGITTQVCRAVTLLHRLVR